jgi:AcrR family transcriptional regulator
VEVGRVTTDEHDDEIADGAATTRERILACALHSFARRGVSATSVVDIEEAAGLSPGSGGFYRHFRNKDDVLHAAVEAEIDRIRRAGEHHLDLTDDDPRVELTRRLTRQLDDLALLDDLMLLLARDTEMVADLIPQIFEVMAQHGVNLDTEVLTRYMAAGAIPERDPDVLAAVLLSGALGYALARVFFGSPLGDVPAETFAATLADLVVGDPAMVTAEPL